MVVMGTKDSLRINKQINKIHAVVLKILVIPLCLSLWQKTSDNLNNNLAVVV